MTEQARDEQMRRILRRLGSEPTELPPEVADRLHRTLRELVEERDAEETAPPSQLRAARRPQLLLAAAAAVLVVALGGATLLTLTRSGDVSASSDAGAATAEKADPGEPLHSAPPQDADGSGSTAALAGLPILRADDFEADVSRLLRRSMHPPEGGSQRGIPTPAADCTAPAASGPVEIRPVLYDDALALLVLHPPRDGTLLAEAWTCSGETRLASARVSPAPRRR